MSVEIICPKCGRTFNAKESQIGRRDACKICGKIIHFIAGQAPPGQTPLAQTPAPPVRRPTSAGPIQRPAPPTAQPDRSAASAPVLDPIIAPAPSPAADSFGAGVAPPPLPAAAQRPAAPPGREYASEYRAGVLMARLRSNPNACPNCLNWNVPPATRYGVGSEGKVHVCPRCDCSWSTGGSAPFPTPIIVVVAAVIGIVLALTGAWPCAIVLFPIFAIVVKALKKSSKAGEARLAIIDPGRPEEGA